MGAQGYTGNPPGGGGGGSGAVDSVNGRTGAVTLAKADVGLTNVDNTSDVNKPVSNAMTTALSGKAASVHTHAESDVTSLVSDLALKAPLASPALTGNPTAPTQTALNASTRVATTAYVDSAVTAGGGGGGASATFTRGYVVSGDITLATDASWTIVPGLTFVAAALAGEDVTLDVDLLIQMGTADFFDLVTVVGGAIQRYASTGTSSPTAANEGDPSLYAISGSPFRGSHAHWSLAVASGDLSGGNVTFAFAHKGSGAAGKIFASANYPLRWSIRNDH